jgi:hypothetical protein
MKPGIKHFKSKQHFAKAYKNYCRKAYLRNFAFEAFNWAAFCRIESNGKIYDVKPNSTFLTIEITELETV